MRTSDPARYAVPTCPSCGARPLAGFADCRAMWDELLARSFSALDLARYHRQIVDLYSMQHPDEYCASAKSYAAHLTGLCCYAERGGEPAIQAAVQRWLSTNPELHKPPIPDRRGEITLADLLAADDPAQVAEVMERWTAAVWAAYADTHDLARDWIERAFATR